LSTKPVMTGPRNPEIAKARFMRPNALRGATKADVDIDRKVDCIGSH
jgi:hypothetical protein